MDGQALHDKSMATLFVSFDLVNCTHYKFTHKGTWTAGVSGVLGHLIQTFGSKSGEGYRFWKVLGDEVVFTKTLPLVFELQEILDQLYQELVCVNQKIANGDMGEDTKVLSVKATVWLAGFLPQERDNVYLEYQIDSDHLQSEYLGTDIDAGFRISQYTSSGRMVISFELAAFFLKDRLLKRNLHQIHFVGYRSLKGIWDGRDYPIFMYHGDGDFDSSIVDTSDPKAAILKEYLQQKPQRVVQPPYTSYQQQVLETLCQDETLNARVDQLMAVVKQQWMHTTAAPSSQLQVHYSVLCYAQDEQGIRFMTTRDTAGTLGFGGAKMAHNLQYLDRISTYYHEEFRVELDFVKDKRYHDPIPLILEPYQTEEGLPGTLFLAKIDPEKLWGNLSETYTATLQPAQDVADFSFYTCNLSAQALLEKAMTYIENT